MIPNTISVRAYLVNGDVNDILENASPKEAIENYLFPDMRPPVQTIVLDAVTAEGKKLNISISPTSITASIQ
ncbi:MAG TPA: hypothetical protein VIJ75_16065 [Hanamia sp.]